MSAITPSASITKPATTGTPYGAGDLIANSATAGSVTAMEFDVSGVRGRGVIRAGRVKKSGPTATNASYRLHIFTEAKTVANGDNGTFVPSNLDGYLGYIAVDASSVGLAGTADLQHRGAPAGGDMVFELPDNRPKLYGYLAAAAGLPEVSAEVFTATLEIEQG